MAQTNKFAHVASKRLSAASMLKTMELSMRENTESINKLKVRRDTRDTILSMQSIPDSIGSDMRTPREGITTDYKDKPKSSS